MKISVCIPAYERPELLEKAVLSAAAQSLKPYEILVSDDSKTDTTEKVVMRLQGSAELTGIELRYRKNRPGLGQGANVQQLFRWASGDLITLLHDDDHYLENAFEVLVKPLKENPDIVASYGRQIIQYEDGTQDIERSWRSMGNYGKGRDVASHLVEDSLMAGSLQHIPNNGYFVRREAAQSIDYFDNNRASKACDFYFGFRLGQLRAPFYFVAEFVSVYYLSKVSSARSGTDSSYHKFEILADFYKDKKVDSKLLERMRSICPAAIMQACNIRPSNGWRWFFSRYHRGKILSLGGCKRFVYLIRSSLRI